MNIGPQFRQPSLDFWLDYLAACQQFASECGVDHRTLDKALWQYAVDSHS